MSLKEIELTEAQKVKLERLSPIWVVVISEPEQPIKGLIENSFSMEKHPSYIRMFWSGKAYSMLGEHELNGKEDADYNARESISYAYAALLDWKYQPYKKNHAIYNINDPNIPVTIDIKAYLSSMLDANDSKFNKRNAKFIVKKI